MIKIMNKNFLYFELNCVLIYSQLNIKRLGKHEPFFIPDQKQFLSLSQFKI